EVERADGAQRGDADGAVGEAREELLGEADALPAEDEGVARGEGGVEVARGGDGGEEVKPGAGRLARPGVEEVLEVDVLADVHEVPVVDPGTAHAVVVDAETQRADEVHGGGRGGAEAGDVARVGRDLRLDEDHVERCPEGPGAEAWGRGGGARHASTETRAVAPP